MYIPTSYYQTIIHLIIITELLMEGNAKATFTSYLMENGQKN